MQLLAGGLAGGSKFMNIFDIFLISFFYLYLHFLYLHFLRLPSFLMLGIARVIEVPLIFRIFSRIVFPLFSQRISPFY